MRVYHSGSGVRLGSGVMVDVGPGVGVAVRVAVGDAEGVMEAGIGEATWQEARKIIAVAERNKERKRVFLVSSLFPSCFFVFFVEKSLSMRPIQEEHFRQQAGVHVLVELVDGLF